MGKKSTIIKTEIKLQINQKALEQLEKWDDNKPNEIFSAERSDEQKKITRKLLSKPQKTGA